MKPGFSPILAIFSSADSPSTLLLSQAVLAKFIFQQDDQPEPLYSSVSFAAEGFNPPAIHAAL